MYYFRIFFGTLLFQQLQFGSFTKYAGSRLSFNLPKLLRGAVVVSKGHLQLGINSITGYKIDHRFQRVVTDVRIYSSRRPLSAEENKGVMGKSRNIRQCSQLNST